MANAAEKIELEGFYILSIVPFPEKGKAPMKIQYRRLSFGNFLWSRFSLEDSPSQKSYPRLLWWVVILAMFVIRLVSLFTM